MGLLTRLRACCKGASTYTKRANGLPTTGSQITRTVATISACALVLASAGFGATYAWTIGVEHGPMLAGLMVLMALGLEGVKPIAVASALSAFGSLAIVRGLALSLLAAVAIVYSLTSELALVASSRSDLTARRAAVIEHTDNRHARIEAARSELAALAPSRPVADVNAEVTKLLADNPKAGDCTRLDGPVSRSACPTVMTLQAEIARTERRSELQATIGKLTEGAPAVAVKAADPASAALAAYLAAIGVAVPAGLLSEWLVLVPVLALEVGAAVALVLVQAVSGPLAARETANVVEEKADSRTRTQPAQSGTVPDTAKDRTNPGDPPQPPRGKRTRRKPTKRTRDTKRRLGTVVDLLKARGGHLKGGQRTLARELKLSKSRVNELLHEAADAGVVRLKTTKRGTSVALVA